MTARLTKVLCCVDYFLPGYAGGGPIRSIANMQKLLAGDVELDILTRDRDLGAAAPYQGIAVNSWNQTNGGRVFYAGPKMFGVCGLQYCMEKERFDLVYLNSFFSPHASIRPYLWLRRTHPELPILIAPRGEFSPGALGLKHTKKRAFLTIARAMGLYRDVQWHASTADEKEDILRQFPAAAAIHLAADPVIAEHGQSLPDGLSTEQDDLLRIVFISRISPMKNLDGLLRIIATLPCRARLDIFGPIEDVAYWRMCEELIEGLPPHLSAQYKGPLAPEAVSSTFAAYHLFAFPTLGENFGHVVFEALRVGTPVLLSDRTPWRTQATGAITAIPLNDTKGWRSALYRAATQTPEERLEMRAATRSYARVYVRNSDDLRKNVLMFEAGAMEPTHRTRRKRHGLERSTKKN